MLQNNYQLHSDMLIELRSLCDLRCCFLPSIEQLSQNSRATIPFELLLHAHANVQAPRGGIAAAVGSFDANQVVTRLFIAMDRPGVAVFCVNCDGAVAADFHGRTA